MASEYVSFMLMFSLGISMVVAITITMQDMTSTVQETSAEVELERLLESIRDKLYSMYSSFSILNGVGLTLDNNLDLPSLLVNKFYYQITIEVKNGTYYLAGTVLSENTQIIIEKILYFNSNEVSITGSISSTKSNPFLSFQKDSVSQVTIELGNS